MDTVPERNPPPCLFSEALSEKPPTFVGELWLLVRSTGKWWLVPILLVLLLLGAVVLLSATCYAPFIYTLF